MKISISLGQKVIQGLGVLCLGTLLAGGPARAQTVAVGTGPVALAVNPTTNQVYVDSSPVTVINGASLVATKLPAAVGGPSGMALNPVANKAYFLNGTTVYVVDGATSAVTAISLGSFGAYAIAVNSTTNKAYVTAYGTAGGEVAVIDGASNSISATVSVAAAPYTIAVNPVTNKVYTSNSDGTVTVIDGATNATTTLTGFAAGGYIAINPTTNLIYIGVRTLMIINGATNTVIGSTGSSVAGVVDAIAINPVTNLLYVAVEAQGNNALTTPGMVTVINAASNTLVANLTTGILPQTITINTVTNAIYIANTYSNNISILDGTTNTITTVPTGTSPSDVAINSATNTYYVANYGDNTVTVGAGIAGTTVAPPVFTVSPQNQSVGTGQSVTFSGAASGSTSYQWLFNNAPISGATSASLTLTNAGASSAGTYTLVATNGGGSVSASATLAVVALAAPIFTGQPTSQTVVGGTTVVFNSAASGSPAPTYQWKLNGNAIAGAISARLVITGATSANAGSYTNVATNSQGSATSNVATLATASTANVGRLVNLSVNTTAGKSQVLTVGFVSGGSGTSGTENLLIRATGPALTALGVPNTLADPTLSVLSGSTVLVSNDNWGTPSSNQSAVTAADAATFAFPLSNTASLDAAVAQAFSSGADTVQVSGNTAASGTALAEVYDNTPTASYTLATPRLINLSAKNQLVASGSMTAGFVVGGTTAKTVLIRATGPALALLGVPGTIPDPQIALHTTINNQDTVLASNAGWGGDPQITAASNSVFAFPLTNPASLDSVVLVTLPPASYTAVASSVSGAAGTVLIEVYEVP